MSLLIVTNEINEENRRAAYIFRSWRPHWQHADERFDADNLTTYRQAHAPTFSLRVGSSPKALCNLYLILITTLRKS